MKYLGIDYGTKNIGVAVSDGNGRVAFPLATIAAGKTALAEVSALVSEHGIGQIVVGESRNLAGEPNALHARAEEFSRELGELSGVPVAFEREFFTSALAARQYAPEEKSRKANPPQEKLDASAAALKLQSYLDRAGGVR
jgi:putative Holliday junction resolvase